MKEKLLAKIREYTGHKYVKITTRGNSAILSALYIAKKVNPKAFMLVPDQGGWPTYRTYSELMGMSVKEIKTDNGIIDLADLKDKIKTGSAFIVNALAGYFAEQPVKEIYDICRDANCLLILDVSGVIGDDELCDGEFADLMICSFGKWKVVDVGYGGFVSTNDLNYFEKSEVPFSLIRVYPDSYPEILKKLQGASKRVEFLYENAKKVKKDLAKYDIIHRDKKGLNVVVKYNRTAEKDEIIEYCKQHNLEYVECPKNIRVDTEAISIEVKRL